MSTLKRLGLAGFRSYGIEEMEKIDFNVPLTLILGKNGSGKSTILEVLWYLITGIFPPNTKKGRSFIWDPIYDNQAETKACGKLSIQMKSGN